MADQSDVLKAEKLRIAVDTRALEINLFWQRSLFFWGFNIAAGAGFTWSYKDAPTIATAMACFGTICSFIWSLVNRGSKYWQENWERKAEVAAREYLKEPLFGALEPIHDPSWLGAKRFSVTALAAALSDFTTIGWTFAALYNLCRIEADPEVLKSNPIGLNVTLVALSGAYLIWTFIRSERFSTVVLGPYLKLDDADRLADQLRSSGIRVIVEDRELTAWQTAEEVPRRVYLRIFKSDEKAACTIVESCQPGRVPRPV